MARHLPRTGPGATPVTPGTRTCPATCTLTTEEPTSAPQLTRARTTVPSVQRTGRAEMCTRRPGLPYLCRARPLLRAAPARLARARPAHRTGVAHPEACTVAGRAVLCVPWRTLAGWSSEPGELSRIGPVTAGVARDLALAAAADVTCDWKVIVVGRSGRALAVAKVRRTRADAQVRSAGSASAAASGSGDAGVVGRITLTIPAGLLSPAASRFPRPPRRRSRNWRVPARSLRSSRRPCGRGRRRSPPAGHGPRLVAAPTRRQAPVTGSRTRCARSSRHATRRAGSPPAVSRPGGASRTTRSPTAWAARPARATCRLNAPVTTTSSTCRAGGSTSPGRGF